MLVVFLRFGAEQLELVLLQQPFELEHVLVIVPSLLKAKYVEVEFQKCINDVPHLRFFSESSAVPSSCSYTG